MSSVLIFTSGIVRQEVKNCKLGCSVEELNIIIAVPQSEDLLP